MDVNRQMPMSCLSNLKVLSEHFFEYSINILKYAQTFLYWKDVKIIG
jgi:hypothetical protein